MHVDIVYTHMNTYFVYRSRTESTGARGGRSGGPGQRHRAADGRPKLKRSEIPSCPAPVRFLFYYYLFVVFFKFFLSSLLFSPVGITALACPIFPGYPPYRLIERLRSVRSIVRGGGTRPRQYIYRHLTNTDLV